jgi:hypothetical protein
VAMPEFFGATVDSRGLAVGAHCDASGARFAGT